jgi:hypothetical protein
MEDLKAADCSFLDSISKKKNHRTGFCFKINYLKWITVEPKV